MTVTRDDSRAGTGTLISILAAAVLLVAAGCAKPPVRCTTPEDNPPHHYTRGMELLEEYSLGEAQEKFERAVWCDERYGPAHGGLAIVRAELAAYETDEGHRKVEVDKAEDELRLARKHADTREEEFSYHVASMRVDTILKPRKWLSAVESDYKKAMRLRVDEEKLPFYRGREGATYYMGAAYLEAGQFENARSRFEDVLNSRRTSRWHGPADEGWKKTDKIVRALAGITLGDVGREIAVKDSVRRDDMAALLVDELRVDKLFAGRIPLADDGHEAEFVPADVAGNPFAEEILTLMKWNVRGLAAEYDPGSRAYLFRPDEPVGRKEFALVIEDVLIKLTGDESISKAFFGHDRSPFPDVPATSAWYNAVMNVTTRNIMETELSGEFRPNDVVDGAEAILAIRVLRQRLNIY